MIYQQLIIQSVKKCITIQFMHDVFDNYNHTTKYVNIFRLEVCSEKIVSIYVSNWEEIGLLVT